MSYVLFAKDVKNIGKTNFIGLFFLLLVDGGVGIIALHDCTGIYVCTVDSFFLSLAVLPCHFVYVCRV